MNDGTGDGVTTVEIASWGDLTRYTKEWLGVSRIYRGVSKASHELIPKIGRPSTRRGRPYSLKVEESLFELFLIEARSHVESYAMSRADWLFLVQHHGLPTRLLDWSSSPLIAAYFAVDAAGTDGDAAIYAAPVPDDQFILLKTDPFTYQAKEQMVHAVAPTHISRRITAQKAVFTLHPTPAEPYRPDGLIKAIVKESACLALKRTLKQCGFSRATLFPGLDGICQDITWSAKWTLSDPNADTVPQAD